MRPRDMLKQPSRFGHDGVSAADWIFKENYALVLAALFQHEFARGLRAYFRAGSMPLTRWCSYHQVDYEHWLNIRRGVVR
ncbi:MAG: hypothetical protein M0Z95_09225, partial [Actinomycetota bacterium]|nr:hypothetical protein [Actinomycetota bacterium]